MQTGWLAPNGDFYPCEVFDHIGAAEDIIDRLNIQINGRYSSDDILWHSGWVKITRSSIGMKEQNIVWEKYLTEYQKNFLKPYFEENDGQISSTAIILWEHEMDR